MKCPPIEDFLHKPSMVYCLWHVGELGKGGHNNTDYLLCHAHDFGEYTELFGIEVIRKTYAPAVAPRTDPTSSKIRCSGHNAMRARKRHPDLRNIVRAARDVVRCAHSQQLINKHGIWPLTRVARVFNGQQLRLSMVIPAPPSFVVVGTTVA